MRPYPTYLRSGLPWLGYMPQNWELRRARYLFEKMERRVREEDEVVTAFRDGTVTLRRNRRIDGFTFSEKEIGYQGIRQGDLVIHAMDAFAGAIGISDSDGKGSPVYTVLRSKAGGVADLRYYSFLLRHLANSAYIASLSQGIRERSTDFRFKILRDLTLPLPLPREQRAIAEFLDRKTTEIDDLIEQKQRLIELLEEKRTALITQAVTKGLDPEVEMKDSGVEWLGQIPAHWGATRLRFLTSRIVDGVHSTPEYVDFGVPFVTVRNLTAVDEGISLEEGNYISEAAHSALTKRATPERGDILLTKDGTLGVPRVVDTDRAFSIFVSVALLKVERHKVDPTFLRFALEADSTTQQFGARTLGSALTHLHLGQIANVYVSLPPLPEQQRIGAELKRQLGSLSSTRGLIRKAIDLLREYRTALISAAVTGKIDVREEAA